MHHLRFLFCAICIVGLNSLLFVACYNCEQANTDLNENAKAWTDITQSDRLIFKNDKQEFDTIQIEKLRDSFHCAGEECRGECEFYKNNFINENQDKFFSMRSFSNYVEIYLYREFNNNYFEEYSGTIHVIRDTVYSWKNSKLSLVDSIGNRILIVEAENPIDNNINIRKLYFQKHKGLIAYCDVNNEIWNLQ